MKHGSVLRVAGVVLSLSALLGPVFGRLLVEASTGSAGIAVEHYQVGFRPMLVGIIVAIALTCFLRETGAAAHRLSPSVAS